MGAFGIGNAYAYNAEQKADGAAYPGTTIPQAKGDTMDPLVAVGGTAVSTVINDLFYSPADKFRDQLKAEQEKAKVLAAVDAAKAQAQAQAQATQAIAMYAVIGLVAVGGMFVLYKALS